ncbi:DUF6069 family protein [Streptomyces capitiformicae]|uniref:Uncharacterized protein n=1 Tax=Streptomyces capitiformicae TaxID=2014920 RepID=A0A919GQV6_9ACTN|nr:DUF6069 family protein [Streptomyces capitiformicae]GHH88971.1 hypothetical protein GCM10017771_36610 [Streptomyces capitiformicae]
MSVASAAVPVRRGPLVVAGGVLAAIVVSSLANVVLAVLALALGAPDDFQPLMPGSYVFLTAVGVIAGAIGWVVVRKVSKDPEKLVRWLVPTVVVVSFVPDFLLFGAGGVVGVMALLLMHVAVAAAAVFAYRKVMPLS